MKSIGPFFFLLLTILSSPASLHSQTKTTREPSIQFAPSFKSEGCLSQPRLVCFNKQLRLERPEYVLYNQCADPVLGPIGVKELVDALRISRDGAPAPEHQSYEVLQKFQYIPDSVVYLIWTPSRGQLLAYLLPKHQGRVCGSIIEVPVPLRQPTLDKRFLLQPCDAIVVRSLRSRGLDTSIEHGFPVEIGILRGCP